MADTNGSMLSQLTKTSGRGAAEPISAAGKGSASNQRLEAGQEVPEGQGEETSFMAMLLAQHGPVDSQKLKDFMNARDNGSAAQLGSLEEALALLQEGLAGDQAGGKALPLELTEAAAELLEQYGNDLTMTDLQDGAGQGIGLLEQLARLRQGEGDGRSPGQGSERLESLLSRLADVGGQRSGEASADDLDSLLTRLSQEGDKSGKEPSLGPWVNRGLQPSGDVNQLTGLDSPVRPIVMTPPSPGGQQPGPAMPSLEISTPVNQSSWADQLGERVTWMARGEIKTAEIRLNPPQLGPVEARVSVGQDQQVSVTLTSQHAVTREVMEQALPRLREMLAEQGMSLADADVSDQSGSRDLDGQPPSEGDAGQPGHDHDSLAAGDAGEDEMTVLGRGMVDTYA